MIGQEVNKIAEELTSGRSIDLMLSGYNLAVLPFAWSALIAGLLDLELKGLKEKSPPPVYSRLRETKDMVKELKSQLKKYWRCMNL